MSTSGVTRRVVAEFVGTALIGAQTSGAVVGAVVANQMFDLACSRISMCIREW